MENHHLPENREPLEKVQNPPGTTTKKANIKTTLLDSFLNKNTNQLVLKQGTLETVDSYSTVPIHVYTDGSAFKATINDDGAGILLKYPDGTKSKYSTPCGKYCSNYVAEIQAMNKAVEILNSEFTNNAQHPENIVIFTDSLSALQDLESNY